MGALRCRETIAGLSEVSVTEAKFGKMLALTYAPCRQCADSSRAPASGLCPVPPP
ncbi:hypothetical protein SCOCK_610008 [Actinacidiphila cocklensis]|uniref:Uncharacterized protein n=1 Tax=Actinacidiphila cocklensis TaxID=887465 RepID=A0A9W4DUL2_9ACTN|nr:hypothetical protein SCOCK_610008 [Actinacidiphila cocklensis]